MLLIDSPAASYDALYNGIRPNQVTALPFLFFWVGTPLVGGVAAFALHNLRDAFRYSSLATETEDFLSPEESKNPPLSGELKLGDLDSNQD